MEGDDTDHRFRAGTGWAAGYLFALVLGVIAWALADSLAMGVIIFAATGPAIGTALEGALDTTPLTPEQERTVRQAALVGIVVGLIVLAIVVLSL